MLVVRNMSTAPHLIAQASGPLTTQRVLDANLWSAGMSSLPVAFPFFNIFAVTTNSSTVMSSCDTGKGPSLAPLVSVVKRLHHWIDSKCLASTSARRLLSTTSWPFFRRPCLGQKPFLNCLISFQSPLASMLLNHCVLSVFTASLMLFVNYCVSSS